MEKTNTYTYFSITSNGKIENGVGLVANKKAVFDPAVIEKMLEIKPFAKWKKGDKRRNGSEYMFSNFDCEKSAINRDDVNSQCLDTIKNLKNKIDILKKIKETYDVYFCIMIVPKIYDGKQPVVSFNKEIIDFCSATETEIQMDMYIF